VGYIVPIHGPLDGPLYMGSIYTNRAYNPRLVSATGNILKFHCTDPHMRVGQNMYLTR